MFSHDPFIVFIFCALLPSIAVCERPREWMLHAIEKALEPPHKDDTPTPVLAETARMCILISAVSFMVRATALLLHVAIAESKK